MAKNARASAAWPWHQPKASASIKLSAENKWLAWRLWHGENVAIGGRPLYGRRNKLAGISWLASGAWRRNIINGYLA